MDYRYITTEPLDDGRIVRVMLNRPDERNAQNRGLLVELDHALLAAEADDRVRVIILGGEGPVFSAGHDLGTPEAIAERTPGGPDEHPTNKGYGGTEQALQNRYLQEWHFFFQNTLRWRNLRKITVAQVQGKCYAAALMLAWACDLIVASDDAEFADVVGTRLGMCGLEYFAHPWEFGARKTKELLLTGDSLSAEDAYRLGMVAKVFPRDDLADRTLEYARRIASLPSMTSMMIKESVNQTQDQQGFYNALQACFTIHQANHSHWA
ncbi:MAG: enoyl-CoA hydratase, partial [Chloroflexi bacterium]|nr:enoyl-CoA hydratase [Chloroflexota bacterium]